MDGLPQQARLARHACRLVAAALGELSDLAVVVGGLVPSLLIDQRRLPPGAAPHAGTMDVDLGLNLAIVDHERFRIVADRLRGAGFVPVAAEPSGRMTHRWRLADTVQT